MTKGACEEEKFLSEWIMLALPAIGTVLILTWLLRYSSYGIDFTDESFYLVWISNPFLYDVSLSQFGYVYHPLYLILGGDIASLRQANILITFGLAWCLVLLFLKSLSPKVATQKFALNITAAGFAITSLIAFSSLLLTPSYNSLTFQALLVTSIGLLLSDKNDSSKNTVGWILVGIGGWLAFMAKPSTALALAIGVSAYLIYVRKFSFRAALLATVSAIALLLVSALLIDGSIYKFIDRLRTGIQFASYLGGGHTLKGIIRLDSFQLGTIEKLSILFLTPISFIATRFAYSDKSSKKTLSIIVSVLFFCFIVLLPISAASWTTRFGQFRGMIIWGSIFPMIALGFLFGCKNTEDSLIRTKRTSNTISINHLATYYRDRVRCIFNDISTTHRGIALLFFSMPHIFAFGTNNNYWQAGSAVSIFWLLGGLVFLSPLIRIRGKWSFSILLVLTAQTISAVLLQIGMEQPYRQPQPLRLNNYNIEIGATESNLILSTGYAKYFEDAKSAAHHAGFRPGSPVIDLTGQSPGILYALKAENIGQAWTIGGYQGSLKLAIAALNRVPCEKIAAAWVLFEPDGPRGIPTEVMASQGADFPHHYTQVASWHTAEGAGGYSANRVQILYAPTAQQEILKGCQTLHRGEDS